MNLRSTLLLMYMREQMLLHRSAAVDDSGMLINPREFYEALPAVYKSLGPAGLEELERQSGFDAFGNKKGT